MLFLSQKFRHRQRRKRIISFRENRSQTTGRQKRIIEYITRGILVKNKSSLVVDNRKNKTSFKVLIISGIFQNRRFGRIVWMRIVAITSTGNQNFTLCANGELD